MFKKIILDIDTNLFESLEKSINFENIAKGRKGAVLVNYKNDLVPIIRTTTPYNNPVQPFLPIHYDIMDNIRKKFKKNMLFNNAMVEIYDSNYHTMKFHTDQALDLEEKSYICLFSCYENVSNNPLDIRKLQVKNKTTNESFEVSLDNNSAVLFSTSDNHNHLHKIILDQSNQSRKRKTNSPNQWLGITFRLSKTFIKFVHNIPNIYPTNQILRLANSEEKKEFYKYKANENSSCQYTYPEINYTISKSDMLPL